MMMRGHPGSLLLLSVPQACMVFSAAVWGYMSCAFDCRGCCMTPTDCQVDICDMLWCGVGLMRVPLCLNRLSLMAGLCCTPLPAQAAWVFSCAGCHVCFSRVLPGVQPAWHSPLWECGVRPQAVHTPRALGASAHTHWWPRAVPKLTCRVAGLCLKPRSVLCVVLPVLCLQWCSHVLWCI